MPNITVTHEFYLNKTDKTVGVCLCENVNCDRPIDEWEEMWRYCPFCGEPANHKDAIHMTGGLTHWQEVKELLKDESP